MYAKLNAGKCGKITFSMTYDQNENVCRLLCQGCHHMCLFVPVIMASTTVGTVGLVAANIINNASSILSTTTAGATIVKSAPSEPIFLQTKLAQGIAGTFVFAALFLTCQQVSPR